MSATRPFKYLRGTLRYLSFGLRIGVGVPTRLESRQLRCFGRVDLAIVVLLVVWRSSASFAAALGASGLLSGPLHAQSNEASFQEELSAPPFAADGDTTYFTLAVENDSLGSGSDRHYTSGVRATWLSPGKEPTSFATALMDLFGNSDSPTPSASYVSLGQNLYTPEDIAAPQPDPNDRPYAAFLYGSRGYTRALGNRIDNIELTLGVVGPLALGEPTQRAVHDVLDATDPKGWDAQLDNEIGVNVAWERRWPGASVARLGDLQSRLMPHVGVSVGNVYTHASAGLTWQVLPDSHTWQSPPLRVRPAIPGSGFFYSDRSGPGWSAFAGVEVRAVGRNIFLDGNTFESSPSVDKEPFVVDANAGLTLSFERLRIAYTLNWRSREFDGQQNAHLFGALSVSRRF